MRIIRHFLRKAKKRYLFRTILISLKSCICVYGVILLQPFIRFIIFFYTKVILSCLSFSYNIASFMSRVSLILNKRFI